MKLELTSLEKSIASLERSIRAADTHQGQLPADLNETIRSGIIQNFEVAYELSWKMMKRWIETNISTESVDGVTRRELFRQAAENRLINDVDLWMRFHSARNTTSHVYDQQAAEEVSASAREFLPAAKEFLEALQARND
jgi:nucleotidyltransferase substrate binding protein (TIGR01987 family)